MKKVLLSVLVLTGLFFSTAVVQAQTTPMKVGVFDLDLMVQNMPGYRAVDSLVKQYEVDSLGAEYEIYQSEYHRLDSTYKSDSTRGVSKALLDYTFGQKQQMAFNLVYWQQIAQNKSDAKRGQLAQPMYEKVVVAYKKILDTKKYTLILKPQSYEMGTQLDNIFQLVAKELNVPLPPELGGGQEQQQTGAPGKPKTN